MSVVEPEEWVAHEQERLDRELSQLDQLVVTVAGLAIAITEHAKVSRQLMADVDRHEEELAAAHAGIRDVRRVVAGLAEQVKALEPGAAIEMIDSFDDTLEEIENRLGRIEHALPVIERKVGLKRRTEAWSARLLRPEAGAHRRPRAMSLRWAWVPPSACHAPTGQRRHVAPWEHEPPCVRGGTGWSGSIDSATS